MKFRKEYIDVAYKLCKEKNCTREKLAKFFGVRRETITNWGKKCKSFKEAIEDGKKDFWVF